MSNIVKKAIGVLKSPKKRTIILAQHGFFKNMSDEDFLFLHAFLKHLPPKAATQSPIINQSKISLLKNKQRLKIHAPNSKMEFQKDFQKTIQKRKWKDDST